MLSVDTPFPCPGSMALHDGHAWRVHSHNADGSATLFRDTARGSFNRRAPIGELVDPALAHVDQTGLDAPQRAALSWLARQLGSATRVVFEDLRAQNWTDASCGLTALVSPQQLAGLLRRLGWQRRERLRHYGEVRTIWERNAPLRGELVA